MVFKCTRNLLKTMRPPEEFRTIVCFGPLGWGKSAYALKVMVEFIRIYNRRKWRMTNREAWELVKQYIVFHPKQFFEKLRQIRELGIRRIPGIIWDDAGLWLHAMNYNDPFVIAVGKYLNVARSRLGCIFMTTPTPDMVFKKIRKFPQSYTIQITKTTGPGPGLKSYQRKATAYIHTWNIIKGFRTRGPKFYDPYSCKLPEKFYYDWYQPLRDTYEEMALTLMEEEFARVESTRSGSVMDRFAPTLAVPALEKVRLRLHG